MAKIVVDKSEKSLGAYRADEVRVAEDAGQEEDLATGGYGRRQVFELVQNGVDAMIDNPGGRIEVRLTADALYCANEGEPLQKEGLDALMHAHISSKRGVEIGRFGLGFKSVLGVTRHPAFYSRTASFEFDADRTAEQIQETVGTFEHYPVLRLAYPVDPDEHAARDQVLADLMSWATTIVKLPLEHDASWLVDDVDGFPPEFLLFSPHVGQLDLVDERSGVSKTIHLREDGDTVHLTEAGTETTWRVFKTKVRPSDNAKNQAGKLAARDELPLQWAVRLEGGTEIGRFWAFFPLIDMTTLSGIVNAPWQVNDDRTGLLESSLLNRELLDALTGLVVENLESLGGPADPGRFLDLLPARGKERRSWGDGIISKTIYEALRTRDCIPTVSGEVRPIAQVRVPTELNAPLDRTLLTTWSSAPDLAQNWIHPSAIWSTTRRSRIDRLMEQEHVKARPLTEWLESVISRTEPIESSRLALRVAAHLLEGDPDSNHLRAEVRRSKILALQTDQLAYVDANSVYLPNAGDASADLMTIHAALAEDGTIRPFLDHLGFQVGRPEDEFKEVLQQVRFRRRDADWDDIWARARSLEDADEAARLLRSELDSPEDVRVKVVSGAWHKIDDVLLEGAIAQAARDQDVVIDRRFHSKDSAILRALGAVDGPTEGFPFVRDTERYETYRRVCHERYLDEIPLGDSRPREWLMGFNEATITGPLAPFNTLSKFGQAAMCRSLLDANAEFPPWVFRHETATKYPPLQVKHPILWFLKSQGIFSTSLGPRPVRECLGPGFGRWSSILPVVEDLAGREHELGIPNGLDELTTFPDAEQRWDSICSELAGCNDDRQIGSIYAVAARAGLPPPTSGVLARTCDTHTLFEPGQVIICDEVSFNQLRQSGDAALLVPDSDDRSILEERWNLAPRETIIRMEPVAVEAGPSRPLTDYFQLLRPNLASAELTDHTLVPCSELAWQFTTDEGTHTVEESYIDHEQRIYWLAEKGAEWLLDELITRYGFELRAGDVDRILKQRHNQQNIKRLKKLRSLQDDADRLLEAVGSDALRRVLPAGLIEAVTELDGPVDDHRLANVALAVHGYSILRQLRAELETAGFTVPTTWAGSSIARKFVRELGFDESYAGFPGHSRAAKEIVLGPSDLDPQHDYQREMIDRIHELLESAQEHKRALLSLPTGVGKTRIAVQALTERIRAAKLGAPVLWIAQSDELCEQAVQSWSEVWHRYGASADLTISRLWASNDAERARGHQVVIGTHQKLFNLVDDPRYEWLAEATCVVVDEAHTSTGKSYTEILRWLGIWQRGRNQRTRCPLLGLTATAFRGRSESETHALVTRYGKTRIDDGSEDQYTYFQDIRVLAKVEGETLEGVRVELSPDEVARIKGSHIEKVPTQVYDRIAGNTDRNRRLLESIMSQPSDWPILLFAISTAHAHTMAALLRLRGVTAASIDANTNPNLRRRYIDEFRSGTIRVLCNYNVLTAGFDAPRVRAIYVARPVFSPNTYQQMIGRGLRGPRNGGEETCLIVNIADNWSMFGDKIAYTEFEYLWDRSEHDNWLEHG